MEWPQVVYPFSDPKNAAHNEAAEKKSLESVKEAIFESGKSGNSPIAALVVEPIQSEGEVFVPSKREDNLETVELFSDQEMFSLPLFSFSF